MALPSYIKKEGDSVIYNGSGTFVFYVPEAYFTRNIALIKGDVINIIGVLDYTELNSKGKNNGLHPFFFPSAFLTQPSSVEKLKDVKIIATAEPADYRLLKYQKGDKIIVETKVPEDIANVEDLFKLMLISGKIPYTIPYDKIQDYFVESFFVNGNNPSINIQVMGIIVSELCRDKKDKSKNFRLSKNNNMLDYTTDNIATVAKYVSSYSSITSQNWNDAVIYAIMNKNNVDSPMEKILMQ